MLWLVAASLAQENGVLLCQDYEPFFPEVEVDPLCDDTADIAIARVNACFTACTLDQQQFRITLVNRGGRRARGVVLRIEQAGEVFWEETVGVVESTETVQLGPIALTPEEFSDDMIAVVESREDCQLVGNERPLTTALFNGVWPEPSWDFDGDGFRAEACGGDDCDDSDAGVNPVAFEDIGEDKNCDGVIAEDIRRACATAPAAGGFLALVGVFALRRRTR